MIEQKSIIALATLINQLEYTEKLPLEKIKQSQEQQLARIVDHHYKHTPYFKKQVDNCDLTVETISTINGLKKLPIIKKKDIQSVSIESSYVPNRHQPCGIASTSGSTGEPIKVKRTNVNQMFWLANTVRDHQWWKRNPTMKLSTIKATIPEYKEIESWGPPMSVLTKTGPAQGIPISVDIKTQAKYLSEFQPGILIAHAGVLHGLVMHWEKYGFDLKNLKHIKTIGDTCTTDLRNKMHTVTGLVMEDNYSSNEVGCIAIQCPESGQYHIMSESLYVEILDDNNNACNPGQIGRVVVTDLHNTASSIIRYDIGDRAQVGTPCACGRGLPTLTRIIGRERNLFVRKDGSRFWPMAGRDKMLEIAPIQQWQLIQHSLDLIEMKVVTELELSNLQINDLVTMIKNILSYDGDVKITRFSSPLPLNNGKFEEAITMLKTDL